MFIKPSWLLRGEAAVGAVLGVAIYDHLDKGWILFAVLILAPDLSMIGYVSGPRRGAALYNLFHTAMLPFGLAAAGVFFDYKWPVVIAAIWLTHIAVDRVLGFGLKEPTSFKDTHLAKEGGF